MSTNGKAPGPKTSTPNQVDCTKEIVFLLRKLMQGAEQYSKELNRKYQVSAPQLSCLLSLDENGPLPPSQIAKQIMVNSSTVTGIIDRLEQKGLVQRSRVSSDRRVITVNLTVEGKKLARNAPPPIQKKIIDGLQKLPLEQSRKIIEALKTLTEMLDVHDMDVT
jgi:DNA-binding MarR family transcriptional regulator